MPQIPMPITPLRVCPLLSAGTMQVSALVDPNTPGNRRTEFTPIHCLGDKCHLWLGPDKVGNCALSLAGAAAAQTLDMQANQLNLLGAVVRHLQDRGILTEPIVTVKSEEVEPQA